MTMNFQEIFMVITLRLAENLGWIYVCMIVRMYMCVVTSSRNAYILSQAFSILWQTVTIVVNLEVRKFIDIQANFTVIAYQICCKPKMVRMHVCVRMLFMYACMHECVVIDFWLCICTIPAFQQVCRSQYHKVELEVAYAMNPQIIFIMVITSSLAVTLGWLYVCMSVCVHIYAWAFTRHKSLYVYL